MNLSRLRSCLLTLALLALCLMPTIAAQAQTTIYDSQTSGNDFDGTHTVSAIGFTDVNGGIASFSGGNLILTPDSTSGGTNAYLRDYVVRTSSGENRRDESIRVDLPANYISGAGTLGVLLRYQSGSKNAYLVNVAPGAAAGNQFTAFKLVSGAVSGVGTGISLQGTYNAAHTACLEVGVILNPSVIYARFTDTVTGAVIGYLEIDGDTESTLDGASGSLGVVPWISGSGSGSIAISRIRTRTTTLVMCDGDSLTAGQNASSGYTGGTGGATPLNTTYPGVLAKLAGGAYYVANAGHSGYTISQMIGAASGVDGAVATAEQQPIIIAQGGTNDLGNDSTLGGGSSGYSLSASAASSATYTRLQSYTSGRLAATYNNGASTGPKVIWTTITPAQHPVYTTNLGSATVFDARRDAYNALLLAGNGSGSRPSAIVDVAKHPVIGLDGDELNSTYFSGSDFTHLTDAGYAIHGGMAAAILLGSPTITAQPSNTTVTAGSTANFAVTSTGAATTQWFDGSALISGATSASYSRTGTTIGDNGSYFSAVVTSSAGGIVASAQGGLAVFGSSLIHSTDWTTGTVGSASSGGAGTTTGAGDGWIDTAGGNATASGNLLHIVGDGSFYRDNDYVLRPSSETTAVRDQQLIATFPALLPTGSNSTGDRYIVLRNSATNTNYLIGIAYNSGPKIQVFANVSGALTAVGTAVSFSAPTTTDILRVTASATGASPTTVTAVLYDVTTLTTLGSFSGTDSTAGVQAAGQMGVGSGTGTDHATTWSTLATYNLTGATSYTQGLSASSGPVGTGVVITYTPNGNSSATITPAVSGLAGAFSPATVSFDGSNAAKTVTFTPSSSGSATISATNNGSLTNPSSNGYTVSNAGATSYTLTGPSGGSSGVASTSFTVTVNGLYTGTITPAASGVSGTFSPTSLTYSSASAAQTFTFTPSAAGVATISATSSPALTNPSSLTYTAAAGPVAIAPNSSGILYSPYNWLVTSGAAKTINAGAYFRTQIVSSTTCAIGLNIGTATPYSECWARLDSGAWQEYVPTASGVQTWSLTMPSGTTATKHLLEFIVKSTTETADRWNAQLTAIQFNGLTLDAGASVVLPSARKYRVIIFGDSISEGVRVNGYQGIANDTDRNDNTADYTYALGQLLDAEIGVVGFGGSGLTVIGSGNVPALPTSYALLWSGQARAFSPVPDAVIYNEGTNDGTGALGSSLATVITAIGFTGTANTFAGLNGTRQLVLRPFGGYEASSLQAIVSGIANANVVYGDTTGLWSTADSSDGLHPYAYAHIGQIAPGVAALALPLLHPSSGTTVTTTTLALTIAHNGSSQPVLTWVADPAATSYKVMRSTDGAAYTVIATVSSSTLTYTDTAEPVGTIHYAIVSVH